jgi:hypothetical protein
MAVRDAIKVAEKFLGLGVNASGDCRRRGHMTKRGLHSDSWRDIRSWSVRVSPLAALFVCVHDERLGVEW